MENAILVTGVGNEEQIKEIVKIINSTGARTTLVAHKPRRGTEHWHLLVESKAPINAERLHDAKSIEDSKEYIKKGTCVPLD